MILALNVGSSSLKFAVFDVRRKELRLRLKGGVFALHGRPQLRIFTRGGSSVRDLGERPIGIAAATEAVATELGLRGVLEAVSMIGHRIVHGGDRFTSATVLDLEVMEQLRSLLPLAPLHQPLNLKIVEIAGRLFPRAVQIGCFDTAFHAIRPRLATLYGLPRKFAESGIRSYGFHGLSYAHISSVLLERFGPAAGGRAIIAHLGSGASLCGMVGGKSMATTMGFSSLDGLVMSTRCGSLDPGVVLHLLQERNMPVEEVVALLYGQSGLLGISGISGEMQTLLERKCPEAREAVDLFVYRASREIGSMAAAIGGLDTLVFTAGIGENSPVIRARIAQAAGWLGVTVDPERNDADEPCISAPGSPVEVLVVAADEERQVARELLAFGAEKSN